LRFVRDLRREGPSTECAQRARAQLLKFVRRRAASFNIPSIMQCLTKRASVDEFLLMLFFFKKIFLPIFIQANQENAIFLRSLSSIEK